MRQQVLKRDGHRCQWPGCTARHDLEVHHLVPIEDAPHLKDEITNQVTLCATHHLAAARAYRNSMDRRRRRSGDQR